MPKRIAVIIIGLAVICGGCMHTPDSKFRAYGVRYQVANVERSLAFYTGTLGFRVVQQHLPEFAKVMNGEYALLLSGPGSSGSRPLADGTKQSPGGWNRLVVEVDDLEGMVAQLTASGVHLRGPIEKGPAGMQVQIEDPDGNPIEVFQRREAPMGR